MKLECGANKAGRKPFSDYFFAITTDYTFQGNRYWNGSGKYEGDIGQKILNGGDTFGNFRNRSQDFDFGVNFLLFEKKERQKEKNYG